MLIKLPVAHGLSKVCHKPIKELEAYPGQKPLLEVPVRINGLGDLLLYPV